MQSMEKLALEKIVFFHSSIKGKLTMNAQQTIPITENLGVLPKFGKIQELLYGIIGEIVRLDVQVLDQVTYLSFFMNFERQ